MTHLYQRPHLGRGLRDWANRLHPRSRAPCHTPGFQSAQTPAARETSPLERGGSEKPKRIPLMFCLLLKTPIPNLHGQVKLGGFPSHLRTCRFNTELPPFSLGEGPWCFKPRVDFVLTSSLLVTCMWSPCYKNSIKNLSSLPGARLRARPPLLLCLFL